MVYQPLGGMAKALTVERQGNPRDVVVVPSSVWDDATFWKL